MSVWFTVRGFAQSRRVEMCNGTARILLPLLGAVLGSEGYLDGSMRLPKFRRHLARITPEMIREKEKPADPSIGRGDASSKEALTVLVEELRALVAQAEGTTATRVIWK